MVLNAAGTISSAVRHALSCGWLAGIVLLGALAPRAVRGQTAPHTTPWMNASLSRDTRAASLVRAMTLPEKLEQMVGTPGLVPELPQCYGTRHVNGVPRLHIPTLRITNGPVGVGESDCVLVPMANVLARDQMSRLLPHATALPSGMAVAASFDTAVARRFGDVIGAESRALALDVLEGPGVNLARVPQAGRNFEYFGEDPYLTGTMAVAEIRAIQSHGVIAMAKHFVANEQETNRFTVDETVDDRALHELYLLPFEMSVNDGRVAAIMCSYNMVNGVYACEDNVIISPMSCARRGVSPATYSTTSPPSAAPLDRSSPARITICRERSSTTESGRSVLRGTQAPQRARHDTKSPRRTSTARSCAATARCSGSGSSTGRSSRRRSTRCAMALWPIRSASSRRCC